MSLDKNVDAFVIYMTFLNLDLILIQLVKKTQIILLITNKVKILTKYLDF